ncbi:MAG: hypothetical protein EAZ91_14675 [Cytophagales bacterium]|nr:MAG: hypothetical protein EAZ91_14675 [Cytophagales bacterium]
MKNLFVHIVLIAGIMAGVRGRVNAQTVQVVTKVVERTIACPDGLTQRISINARKADVQVRGWNRGVVGIRLRLVAKHTDRAVAEREVGYHQYTLQANGTVIELSNGFVIPQRAGKLQSQLKAVYEISIPNRALLTVNNSFGDVNLRDLAGETTVTFEYGKLNMNELTGKLTIKSEYGDVEGQSVNTTLVCRAEKADIILRDLGGTNRIQSRYGKLYIFPDAGTMDALVVTAERTEVALLPKNLDDFSYDLTAIKTQLYQPHATTDFWTRKNDSELLNYSPPGKKPRLQITSKYGPLHLMLFTKTDVPLGSK